MIELLSSLASIVLSNFWILLLAPLPVLYIYSTRNFDYWKKRGIDGPPAYPFIGNFFSFRTPIPYLYQQYIAKYGKFFGGFRGNKPVLFISDPEVIKRIMVSDFHLFRNRSAQAATSKIAQFNLVNARDEQWKRIRSILTPMFTSSKLRKMEPQMKSCTQAVLDYFERYTRESPSGAIVGAHDAMGNFTMDVIAKCAFATDTNAHEDANNVFVKNAREMMSFNLTRFLMIAALPNFLYRKLRSIKFPVVYLPSSDFFQNLSKHLINERRAARDSGAHEDMLQLMVNAEYEEKDEVYDEKDMLEAHHVNVGAEELETEKNSLKNIIGTKKLNEDEILAQVMVFFLAGYETTASTLSFASFELAVNPEIQERLYQEIQKAKATDPSLGYATVQNLPYLDSVLSETLRKYPPAISNGRECNADEYHIPEINYTLKKGDAVQFPIYAIHHNEEFHKNPEVFNPDRFMPENRDQLVPYSYMPFGGGPRNCIGMRFALIEAKIGLASIIDKYEFFKSSKTPDKLKINLCFPLLKTEKIYIGVRKR